ncbi:restriction endonuclease subunit S [Polaribacter atrinae]|uniref:restriction endonuclease subunit S n=1 Tax=Polaribacter atrinae TaxID=1333662 RepID=UPI00248F9C61|nr:restriction endonuclease subunit S [Polaribacter atrinae]
MGKKLPKNWVETEVGDISEIIRGITYNKLQAKPFKENDDYLVLRGGNIQDGKITTETKDVVYVESNLVKDVQQIKKGDVVIVGSTGSKRLIGKAGIAKEDFKEISFGAFLMLIRPSKLIEASLFDYYFISDNYRNVIRDLAGGVNINNIRREYITNLKFPLPPLAEQQRIVAKLDELFGHLDSLKTRLNNIPQILKNFRQAVLTQAVTGKLTEEWRVGKELGEWKVELAKDCCEKVQSGGTPKGSNFAESGIPFFKVYNIVDQKISFDYRPQFVSEEIQNSQCKKSICFPNDVLMNIVGPPLNKVAIVPEEFPECNINQAITLFRVKEYLNNKYLYYFLREGTPVNSLVNETRGVVGQVNISLTQCRETQISIPPKEEQTEIVKRVEHLFAKADKIEVQYQSLKTKIDSLPQAILAKAFKGELLEQLDTDGSAEVLLEEIQRLKASLSRKPSLRGTKQSQPKKKK